MKIASIVIEKFLIPEWNGNRELPVSEQVKIYFKGIPPQIDKGLYVNNIKGALEYGALIRRYVGKIENLSIGEEQIKNADELLQQSNPLLDDLFIEIFFHLFPKGELEAGE